MLKSDTVDFTPGFVQFQRHILLVSIIKKKRNLDCFFLNTIFSVPSCPQHMKTSVASYILPAWYLCCFKIDLHFNNMYLQNVLQLTRNKKYIPSVSTCTDWQCCWYGRQNISQLSSLYLHCLCKVTGNKCSFISAKSANISQGHARGRICGIKRAISLGSHCAYNYTIIGWTVYANKVRS